MPISSLLILLFLFLQSEIQQCDRIVNPNKERLIYSCIDFVLTLKDLQKFLIDSSL